MTFARNQGVGRRAVLRGSVTIAGAAIVLPALGALGGCSASSPTLGRHIDLIGAIADRIIPATDTPGAVDAGVPAYIAALFNQHFAEEQQAEFLAGLDAIAALARAEGIADVGATPAAKLDAFLASLAANQTDGSAKAVWQQLHDMTVFGFYTSEAATRELAYEEIPGRQIGCLPFEEIGRAWLDRGV